MTYVMGFVTPIETAREAEFTDHAARAAPLMREFGATRVVDAWEDDVADGKVTDFRRAVKIADGEAVGFGWAEFPDKATADAAGEKMMADPRMAELGDIPFDGKRMIWGGFEPIVDRGTPVPGGYVDGFLVAVPTDKKDAYRALAEQACDVFMEHGVVRQMEAWGIEVPDGEVTDFARAVDLQPGETVVFSWCEWPDKAARDAGNAKIMADERMRPPPEEMPFDGKRMVYGGFRTVSQG